jgi:hypothetical protein
MNTVQDISRVHFVDGFPIIASPLNDIKESVLSSFSSMSGVPKRKKS